MYVKNIKCALSIYFGLGLLFTLSATAPGQVNTNPPATPVRLVFVHHSCGDNWLTTGNGNLGNTLDANNYYVRDTYYGWNATQNASIGDLTDLGHWYTWFCDTTIQGNGIPRRDNIMASLYTTNNKHASYTTSVGDPGGENTIIMFKSCYPNSDVKSDNAHPPQDLYGQAYDSDAHTLSNCKEIYRQLLAYFKMRHDKMFVVITAPPRMQSETTPTYAANARTLNNWITRDWLSEGGWENRNVYVFDFYNVLTDPNNHHRVNGGAVEHIASYGDNYSAYATGDSHPSATGNQKATGEFVPLLNYFYNTWRASPLAVSFQPAGATAAPGYMSVDASAYGARGKYGWR